MNCVVADWVVLDADVIKFLINTMWVTSLINHLAQVVLGAAGLGNVTTEYPSR